MLLAYDKYMYQETPSHIAEYRRRGCYNINIVRNMGQIHRLARLVGRLPVSYTHLVKEAGIDVQ